MKRMLPSAMPPAIILPLTVPNLNRLFVARGAAFKSPARALER